MTTNIINRDRPLETQIDIVHGEFGLYSFYGGSYIELTNPDGVFYLNKETLKELNALTSKMLKIMGELENE